MTSTKWREPLRDRLARWLFARMITPEYRGEITQGYILEIQEQCALLPCVQFKLEEETENAC